MSGWFPTSRTALAEAERLRLVALATGTYLLYLFAFGFRGTAPDVLALVESGRGVAGSLPAAASASTLGNPHPLAELLFGFVGASPGGFLATLEWTAPLLVVLSLPAVWQLGRRLAGRTAALAATALFALAPPTVAAATTADVSCLFLFLWAWSLSLTLRADIGALQTPLLWLLGAATVLVWPPFLLWGAVVVLLHVSSTASDDAPGPEGTWRRAAIPGAVLTAPVVVPFVVMLLHPGFWGSPVDGWRQFLEFAMTWQPESWPLAHPTRPGARPSLALGVELLARQYPVLLSVATLYGFVSVGRPEKGPGASAVTGSRGIARRGVLVGLPLALLLPWLHRGPAFGRIEYSLVALPLAAPLAGVALERIARAARDLPFSGSRTIGAALHVVAVGSVAAATVASHPYEGVRRTPLFGGVESAVADGRRLSRDGVLPISTLQRAAARRSGGLHVADVQKVTRAYAGGGYLPETSPVEAVEASGFLRFLRAHRPGSRSARESGRTIVDVDDSTRVVARVQGLPVAILE